MIEKKNINGILRRTNTSSTVPIKNNDEHQRRGPEDIKAEVLDAATESIPKTSIMRRCNLSFAQLKKYTNLLTKLGLLKLSINNGKKIIKTTERGKKWLGQFRKLKEIENGRDITRR